ncbi:MAG: cupin domain-containing protein [Hyphomicrobiaceae bacterium]
MAGDGSKVLRPEDVQEVTGSSYPEEFQPVTKDRFIRRVGDFGGMKNFGVNIVRLAPGGQSSCRHAHSRQDEFVYVMEGECVLETDAGQEKVSAGTYIGFPAGTGDAHRFINKTNRDAYFLVIGDRTANDVVTYPDVDLHGKFGADGKIQFTRKDGTTF